MSLWNLPLILISNCWVKYTITHYKIIVLIVSHTLLFIYCVRTNAESKTNINQDLFLFWWQPIAYILLCKSSSVTTLYPLFPTPSSMFISTLFLLYLMLSEELLKILSRIDDEWSFTFCKSAIFCLYVSTSQLSLFSLSKPLRSYISWIISSLMIFIVLINPCLSKSLIDAAMFTYRLSIWSILMLMIPPVDVQRGTEYLKVNDQRGGAHPLM